MTSSESGLFVWTAHNRSRPNDIYK